MLLGATVGLRYNRGLRKAEGRLFRVKLTDLSRRLPPKITVDLTLQTESNLLHFYLCYKWQANTHV